jgi:predicted RecB family nuclease
MPPPVSNSLTRSAELKIEGTPVYLDVEGVPDRDFYYLIGVRYGNLDSAIQHSLWADNNKDEKRIWTEFLDIIANVQSPVLIHYGSYETTFLKRMSDRYGLPHAESMATRAVKTPVNLLSVVFSQIYFPTFSNGLKDIGHFLGVKWNGSVISGLQSLTLSSQLGAVTRSRVEGCSIGLQSGRLHRTGDRHLPLKADYS